MKGLYIHIPFCVRKCSYCDFYSLPGRTDTIASYVQAVLLEAHAYSPSFLRRDLKGELSSTYAPFQTLYIGGGTPSLLGSQNLTTLITSLTKSFPLPCHSERSEESSSPNCHCVPSPEHAGSGFQPDRPNPIAQDESRQTSLLSKENLRENYFKVSSGGILTESTIELNPESVTPEFLQTVKQLGFNRLSFGIQSLNDKELQSVGRIHTAIQAIEAIKLAQKLNFPSISADLIIGLPGQTGTSLYKSLETLVAMGIQHLSVYCLSLETGTPLANNPPPDLPSDDMQAQLFEETRTFLKSRGFTHYEISNFALPGYECLHNLNYWRGGEYLGLGPAAASHLNGKRFKNRANLDAYLQNPSGQIEDVEKLSPQDKAAEEAMLRLRLLEEGLNTDELTAKFEPANTAGIIRHLNKMVTEGLLIHQGSQYRLTPSRILTSNPIFARVLNC